MDLQSTYAQVGGAFQSALDGISATAILLSIGALIIVMLIGRIIVSIGSAIDLRRATARQQHHYDLDLRRATARQQHHYDPEIKRWSGDDRGRSRRLGWVGQFGRPPKRWSKRYMAYWRVPILPVSIGLLLGGVIGLAYLNFDGQVFKPSSAPVIGRASVVDGDTIEIRGERIRFNGIDAPEHDQQCSDANDELYACGRRSAGVLARLLEESAPTRCEFVTRDRHGRFVGNCYRADGMNVAELIVSKGWAMDWPRYSNGTYVAQQSAAKAQRIGLWAGKFQPPWEWRAEWNVEEPAKIVSPVRFVSTGTCSIKGNISFTTGERIYHVPGQVYYSVTKINTSKGERWFCSEGDARAAGWRKSKL